MDEFHPQLAPYPVLFHHLPAAPFPLFFLHHFYSMSLLTSPFPIFLFSLTLSPPFSFLIYPSQYAHRIILSLLSPHSPRYFPPEVLALLRPLPTANPLSATDAREEAIEEGESGKGQEGEEGEEGGEGDGEDGDTGEENGDRTPGVAQNDKDSLSVYGISKKDPFERRMELLGGSGLAEVRSGVN